MAYKGKITTSGTSEAIRLEKELFKQNPEFKQQAEVRADIIGPGKMLISVLGKQEKDLEEDPIVEAFLSFLERDMQNNPTKLSPLDPATIKKAKALTSKVVYSDKDFDD